MYRTYHKYLNNITIVELLWLKHRCDHAFRKHAYSNILKSLPPKTESFFQIRILIFFIFLLKTYIVGTPLEPPHRGGSNEYPQSMFLGINKKNNVYPVKVGFVGVKIIVCFRDGNLLDIGSSSH